MDDYTSRDARYPSNVAPCCKPLFLSDDDWEHLIRSLRLSRREAEISNLVLEGESEGAMAAALAISAHTVHSHLDRLYRKLHIGSRCELVALLFKTYVERHASQSR